MTFEVQTARDQPSGLHLLAIGLLAGSVLAFEVLLLRLFEFSHWHHFAGLVIALALLGFGAAGTTLSLLGSRVRKLGDRWFLICLLLTTAAMLIVLVLQSQIALRPWFAAWDRAELGRLLLVDFAAFLPFYAAGLALGQVFPRWPEAPNRLYAANLLGSGLGTVVAALLLTALLPEKAMMLVLLVLTGTGVLLAAGRGRWWFATLFMLLALAIGVRLPNPPQPAVSDFKALSLISELPDARTLQTRPGLAGQLRVIRSVSLRFAPGLSLDWTGEIPIADAIIIGSDRVVALAHDYRGIPSHGQASLAGLATRLRPAPAKVLILGSGRWSTAAFAHGHELSWVEPDRRIPDLAGERGLRADVFRESPLRFLARETAGFDVIALDYAFDGKDAAGEDYLLTENGLATALSHLSVNGLLTIPLAVDYPPRVAPRLYATVAAALQRFGVEQPERHLVILRGLQSQLLLASSSPLRQQDLQEIIRFNDRWGFDPVWIPDMDPELVNRFNVLEYPVFHQSAVAALIDGDWPEQSDWFKREVATFDKPYFWSSQKWGRVPELYRNHGPRAAGWLDWSLIMSALSMLVAALLAIVLILVPLGRMPSASSTLNRIQVLVYFSMLGLAFMLIELVVLKRVMLLIEPPVLAAAVIFATFMIGAGLGAAMPGRKQGSEASVRIFGALLPGGLIMLAGLWLAADRLLHLEPLPRIVLVCMSVLPLAWSMGRPFPWGLKIIAGVPEWLPWAWAINGFASVIAASASLLLAVQFGHWALIALGAACYLAAWQIARFGRHGSPK